MDRETGQVKWFNEKKGFGFIVSDQRGEDIFVHYNNIEGDGFKTLRENERVSFVREEGPKGIKAQNVQRMTHEMAQE